MKDDCIEESDISMVIAGPQNDDQCEYSLSGDCGGGGESCLIGDDLVVDIVGIHGVTLDSAVGKTVTVGDPSDGSTNYDIDAFGKIEILSMENGSYVINTNNVWPDSYITIESNVV